MLTATASGITLFVACVAFVSNDYFAFRNFTVMQLSAMADTLASNSTAAVSFGQKKAAEELLASLRNRPSVKYACLLDGESKVFAEYTRDPKLGRPTELLLHEKPGHYFTNDGYLSILKPVVEKGDKLGMIYLHASMDDLYAQLWRYAAIVVAVVIISLVVAMLFSFRLQRIISGPILELATTAKQISTDRDYSLRVPKRSDDEIGVLYEQFNLMLEQIQDRETQLRDARDKLEIRVKERTAQIEDMHKQLLETARRAGMAEVATSVLHNVGNILNSVNVSADLIRERLRKSELTDLNRALAILDEHQNDLATFVSSNQRGKHLAPYLIAAGQSLQGERNELSNLSKVLMENINHMKSIVAMQQSYTGASGLTETLSLTELVDDVIEMHASSFKKHRVEVIKQYDELPEVTIDKHKLVQIMINLVKNAKEAVTEKKLEHPMLTVKIESHGPDRARLVVKDNGVGIREENLGKIFTYGFTTKESGHGFGLHSCANLANEMGGSLYSQSDGPGQGATFTIEIPIVPVAATVTSS